jgi:hypothetical protein
MFEHCWLIVLRGKMLRRLPAGYFVEIVSHRHLRYGSGLLHLFVLGTNVALVGLRAGVVYDVLLGLQLAFLALAALRRGLPRYYALVTGRLSSRSGTTAPRGARRPGTRPGDAVRARQSMSVARASQDARQPVPRGRLTRHDPMVPARGRAGRALLDLWLQLGALDGRRRPGRLAATGIDRAKKSVGAAPGSRSNSA